MRFQLSAMLVCVGTLASAGPYYEITPIRTNPGIYYERIRPVRIQKGCWRIVIYLDLHDFLDVHGPNIDLDANHKRGAVHFDELRCDIILNKDLLNVKMRTLKRLREDIMLAAEKMDVKEINNPPPLTDIRTKRMTALGVVGSLSKNLFGLLQMTQISLTRISISCFMINDENPY